LAKKWEQNPALPGGGEIGGGEWRAQPSSVEGAAGPLPLKARWGWLGQTALPPLSPSLSHAVNTPTTASGWPL